MERRPAARELVDHRLVDSARTSLERTPRRPPAPASRRPSRPCSGPVSPSPMRLKSRAGASGSARSPSHSASSDSSSPSRNSSTTTGCSPKRRSTSISSSAARASRLVRGDHDALAGGQAVGLDHRRVARDRGHARLDVVTTACAAVGTPAASHDLLRVRLRALEARGGRPRPEARDAGGRARVGEPGDERRLRARHHEVDARRARPRAPSTSSARGRAAARRAAIPALPGAQSTSGRCGERASARTIACSRPPPPTTRTSHGHSEAMKSSIGIAVSVS